MLLDASTSGGAAGQAQNQRIVDRATQTPSWMQQQQSQQQQASFPPEGYTAGWPSNAQFGQWNVPVLRQPSGLQTVYVIGSSGISIII